MKNTEAATQGKSISKTFARLRKDRDNLKAILICPAFNMTQRMGIKKLILDIEDATTGVNSRQQHAREIYGELKATKPYVDDEKKLKKLLEETQAIVGKAETENITLPETSPILVSESMLSYEFETENHRTAWMAIFYDLEGEYLV